jgi:hypothetical protein
MQTILEIVSFIHFSVKIHHNLKIFLDEMDVEAKPYDIPSCCLLRWLGLLNEWSL